MVIGEVISAVVPFYRSLKMLAVHLDTWAAYSDQVRYAMKLIVIDDGSPEPAEPLVRGLDIQLYRITKDIPWNRNGARNLGSHVAKHDWLLHMDIDHLMPPESAEALVWLLPKLCTRNWFRCRRFRVGKADETRNKDAIPRDQEFGEIKPHIDSYLCRRDLYQKVGGYDEDYSGCLGGGGPFLKQLESAAPVALLPSEVFLNVYTRHAVPDASVSTLSRDTSEYSRRRKAKEKAGNTKAKNPLRFEWERLQ